MSATDAPVWFNNIQVARSEAAQAREMQDWAPFIAAYMDEVSTLTATPEATWTAAASSTAAAAAVAAQIGALTTNVLVSSGMTAADVAAANAVIVVYGQGTGSASATGDALAVCAVSCQELSGAADEINAESSYSVAMSEILAAISSAVAVIFGTLPAKFVIRAFASADRVRAMTKTELIRAKVDANVAVVKTADIRIVCLDTPASVRASADAPLVRGKP